MQNMEELESKINKIIKTYEITTNTASFNVLPWIIFFISLFIIVTYLIKIEIYSNGKNWEINKCSSKYVFFSGFMINDGNPMQKTMDNFKECIKRFS
jgi:hypothetical protein